MKSWFWNAAFQQKSCSTTAGLEQTVRGGEKEHPIIPRRTQFVKRKCKLTSSITLSAPTIIKNDKAQIHLCKTPKLTTEQLPRCLNERSANAF